MGINKPSFYYALIERVLTMSRKKVSKKAVNLKSNINNSLINICTCYRLKEEKNADSKLEKEYQRLIKKANSFNAF